MNKVLKTVKTELEWLDKDYKASLSFKGHKNLEKLSYLILYNRKKISLKIHFLYMPHEQAVVVNLSYDIKLKNKVDRTEEFSFSDVSKGNNLPIINPDDIKRISDTLNYEVVDGKIVSTLSPLTQALTFTEIIKRNINTIVDYGKIIQKSF
jgi:hypothetical protein